MFWPAVVCGYLTDKGVSGLCLTCSERGINGSAFGFKEDLLASGVAAGALELTAVPVVGVGPYAIELLHFCKTVLLGQQTLIKVHGCSSILRACKVRTFRIATHHVHKSFLPGRLA